MTRPLIHFSYAMETLRREERHITRGIKGISRERCASFRKRVDEMRQEFLADERAAASVDNVYALKVQLFPLMSVSTEDCWHTYR